MEKQDFRDLNMVSKIKLYWYDVFMATPFNTSTWQLESEQKLSFSRRRRDLHMDPDLYQTIVNYKTKREYPSGVSKKKKKKK